MLSATNDRHQEIAKMFLVAFLSIQTSAQNEQKSCSELQQVFNFATYQKRWAKPGFSRSRKPDFARDVRKPPS
jgi:hypothetical protein